MGKRMLVSFMGLSTGSKGYSITEYDLGCGYDEKRWFRTRFAGLAILKRLQCLGELPERLVVLYSREVAERTFSYPEIASESLTNLDAFIALIHKEFPGMQVDKLLIPTGVKAEDLKELYEALEGALERGEEEPPLVHLDVTHGYRSLPIITTALMDILSAKGKIVLEGVWYGQFEKEKSYIIDLGTFILMRNFATAARSFKRYGRLEELGERFQELGKGLYREYGLKTEEFPLKRIGEVLQKAAMYLARGMILEFRLEVGRIKSHLERVLDGLKGNEERFKGVQALLAPLTEELEWLKSVVDEYALFGKKEELVLDKEEVKKEFKIIELMKDMGLVTEAVLLLREWFITKVEAESSSKIPSEKWLDRDLRECASGFLNSLWDNNRKQPREELSECQRRLARLWNSVINFRNKLAHPGFTQSSVDLKDTGKTLEQWLNDLDLLLRDCEDEIWRIPEDFECERVPSF